MTETHKRITLRRAQPNPLFQKWLQELYDEAKAKDSKLQNMLKEALSSISKYPLPLQSGSECAILHGFGKKLCLFLDKRLEVHNFNVEINKHNSELLPEIIKCDEKIIDTTNVNNKLVKSKSDEAQYNCSDGNGIVHEIKPDTINRKNKLDKKKLYKPTYKSGGYAILVALYNHCNTTSENSALSKADLIDKAQPFCEESFIRPKPDSHYTAWSNMSRLITKGLVIKINGKKTEYKLSEKGMSLAKELVKEMGNHQSTNDIINKNMQYLDVDNDNVQEENYENYLKLTDTVPNISEQVDFAAGSYDVYLLIDKQETSGASKKNDPTVAQFNKFPDLKHEFRHLKVGDFTWVAKHKYLKDQELILPYIVERKRMDDLAASIKDGRFYEQKFRLKKCGIPNVFYLIENYGSNKHVGLPIQNLMQAIVNTRVQDGFKVHVTESLSNTARFLAMLSKRLSIEYKDKPLVGRNQEPINNELMTFSFFNKSSCKNKALTVTETFIKLLLQLKGVSVEKALAITNVYKTPRSLMVAYSKCSQKEGEILLANLKHGDKCRNVGPTISKSIYQLFSINKLL